MPRSMRQSSNCSLARTCSVPSTSQCLRLSEQSACTSQLPLPLLPSLSTFLPARSSVVVSRHPEVGGRSIHLRIVPSPTEATKHRHREDAARVENGIRRESQSAPHIPKINKKRGASLVSRRRTKQLLGAILSRNVALLFCWPPSQLCLVFVVCHPCALSSGRQPCFVIPSLSLACPPFS